MALCPAPGDPPCEAGAVVVVLAGTDGDGEFDAEEDWLFSSCTSFSSSALSVDCAEETASLNAVASSVPNDCPAMTCSPTVAAIVATFPATWNEAEASLTGCTVPTMVMVC